MLSCRTPKGSRVYSRENIISYFISVTIAYKVGKVDRVSTRDPLTQKFEHNAYHPRHSIDISARGIDIDNDLKGVE